MSLCGALLYFEIANKFLFPGNTRDEVKNLSNSVLTARPPELPRQQTVATVILIYCSGYYADGGEHPGWGTGGSVNIQGVTIFFFLILPWHGS
jgi:hypothetical protein